MKLILPLFLLLLLLPACRIGSGFDSAEKRANLMWDDVPEQVEETQTSTEATDKPETPTVEQLQSPPIVYLLVAG